MISTGVLTINLAAIAQNWSFLDQYTGATAVCGAVVKANAYGLGDEPVSKALCSVGCRVFCVATLDEAKRLRTFLPQECEVIVLNGLTGELNSDQCSSDWVDYRLTPVLFSTDMIRHWSTFCSSHQQALPCVLKIDTGMHRLGILPSQLDEALLCGQLKSVNLRYIMSHFACADEPLHGMNQRQIDTFTQCASRIQQHFPQAKLSLSNSSGIFLSQAPHFNLVRPGAALYGVNPTPAQSNPMRPVVGLTLPVMQLKTIAAGEAVGYGADFTTTRPTRLAIVNGGYGDGLFRSLANFGSAQCLGQKVPMVGRMSMDSIAFDITDVQSGAEVKSIELIGQHQTIDELAKAAGTIAYELLTNLGARYQRDYINMP